jgi:CBS domain containing-hemolysin-like protein
MPHDSNEEGSLSKEDLLKLVEHIDQTPDIEAEDQDMIHSVVEFGQTLAHEIMVPRTDMVTLQAQTPLRKAMSLFLRSGHSRLPVIGSSADDPLGVAYLKDVALRLQADPDADELHVERLCRKAWFTPESKRIDDLLREMQHRGSHIALVVDEYGGVAGLITLEDILEEIVGELTDEHDPDPDVPEALGEGVFRVSSRYPLDEVGELFGLEIDDDEVDSVGGLLAKTIGRVPVVGNKADALGIHMEAERVEGRRKLLTTILVSRMPESTDGDGHARRAE